MVRLEFNSGGGLLLTPLDGFSWAKGFSRLAHDKSSPPPEIKKRIPVQDSPPLEPAGRPSLTWAQCFKRVYEINPLECPRCKSQMRIIAFVTNEREISKIATSLGIPKATAPPPIPKAPQQELFDEIPRDDFI